MNRDELSTYVGITGFSLGQVEKDYFQHIVLGSISRKISGGMIFKGGTALQKRGYVNRFSEDLDFTVVKEIDLERIIKSSIESISAYNYGASYDRIRKSKNSSGFRLKIEGPLFQRGKGICAISLDISMREKVIIPPEAREYSPVYPDVLPYIFPTMVLKEILAEKIRALLTRTRPRDMYDASCLVERGIGIDIDLVNRKLSYYGLSFYSDRLLERCLELSKSWDIELKQLLGKAPDHGRSLDIIKNAL